MILDPIYCKKCRRKLLVGQIIKIEIKCPKCGYINNFNIDKKTNRLYSKENQGIERFDRQP